MELLFLWFFIEPFSCGESVAICFLALSLVLEEQSGGSEVIVRRRGW